MFLKIQSSREKKTPNKSSSSCVAAAHHRVKGSPKELHYTKQKPELDAEEKKHEMEAGWAIFDMEEGDGIRRG